MEPVILEKFSVNIDRDEVIRLLGKKDGLPGGRSDRQKEQIEKALHESLAMSRGLVEPRGIYIIAAGSDLPGSDIFAGLQQVAFCICTIGPKLEEVVAELNGEGRLLRALVLDSVGSAGAEAVARHIDGVIRAEAAKGGLKTSCRASPGYGDWDVKEQKNFFSLLDGGRIGVTLTGSCMMVPRKSISFAMHIASEPVRLRSENSCRNCDMDICPYRICDL